VQARCLGGENGITFFFVNKPLFKKKVFVFMRDKLLLLVSYSDYKPGIDYAQRWAGK